MSEQGPQDVGAAQKQRAPDGTFGPDNPYKFPPGQSGNPGGRPKGVSVWAAILRELAKNPDADGIGEKTGELAKRFVSIALQGEESASLKAIGEALTRADGLPVKREERTVEMRSIVLEERPPDAGSI